MKSNNNSDKNIIVFCSLCFIVIFTMDTMIPLGVAGGVPYILVILISLWSDRKNLAIYMAIIASALTIIGYFTSPAGGELWMVINNRALAIFAIWIVTILSVQRKNIYQEKEKALSDVKVLSGFIPICASCKNIRDEKGYWNQIEAYIRDNSEADFSHGICPDCAKKLYPEINVYDDK